jgi:phage FluMu gp28-like protein
MNERAITEQEWADTRRAGLQLGRREFLALAAGGVAAALTGAFAERIPDVLIDYQKKLLATTARHPVTVVEKSRRTGVTWAAGADAVLSSSANRAAGGMDTLYIGYNLDMAREFIDVCAMWARSFNEAVSETGVQEFIFDDGEPDSNIKAFRIAFASGYEIIALSSKPRSLRGRQGYVIIDEAAFHDDLKALLQAALALLMWGGKILVISTHYTEENDFNKLVEDIRAKRVPYELMRLTFDDALKDGLYQRICLVTRKEWSPEAEAKWRANIIAFYGEAADEELFCVPSKGGGIYLPRALIEARMLGDLPVFRLERPDRFTFLSKEAREADIKGWCEETLEAALKALDKDRQHGFGQDFARKSDLSVIAPIEIGRTLKRTVPFVVEMRGIPFEQQRQVLFYICDRLPRFIGGKMDATGNGAYLAEVAAQRYGAQRIEQVKPNETWYLENFPPLKAAFEDANILIPKDADLTSDLAMIKTIRGVPRVPDERNTGADGKKRHGDFAIALVLAYAQTLSDLWEAGYTSAATMRANTVLGGPDDEVGERGWWTPPLGARLRGSI